MLRNAARHLRPGGRLVIELWVPPIQRMSEGSDAVPMSLDEGHLVVDTYPASSRRAAHHTTISATPTEACGTK